MKKILLVLSLLVSVLAMGFNAEFSLGGRANISDSKNPIDIGIKWYHTSKYFDMNVDLPFSNDGKYNFGDNSLYKGFAFYNKDAWIKIKINDTLYFKTGKMILKDELDSPYSSFISGNNNSAFGMEIKYEDSTFFYKTLWAELVSNSSWGFKDRGTNYKTYGLKFDNFRFGFQDQAVYSGRSFDLQYFANPLFTYALQEARHAAPNPWDQPFNDNTIMGFFGDYKTKDYYVFAQILVDDFNMNRILKPSGFQNPDKLAWNIGGKLNSSYGKIGLYHGGATKYTFQSGNNPNDYGDTFYPANQFFFGSDLKTIDYIDNYFGYKYGENNIAFMIDHTYDYKFSKDISSNFYTSLEFVLSGSKSPVNAWFGEGVPQGTHLFDGDSKLEQTYKLNFVVNTKLYENYSILTFINLGRINNVLELDKSITQNSDNNDPVKRGIWRPSNNNKDIFTLGFSIGVKF